MRVQRAPSAVDQPQRPPVGVAVALGRAASTGRPAPTGSDVAAPASAPPFSAGIDLDLTGLLRRLDSESQVAAEVIVQLVAASRQERLIDDDAALQLVKLTDDGLVGVQLDRAVYLSASAISSGLESSSRRLPADTSQTLTVIHLAATRVRAVGDWGLGGVGGGVVTLGRIVPTLASSPKHGLSITQRCLAHLDFTVRGSSKATGVVRALDRVGRSVEDL